MTVTATGIVDYSFAAPGFPTSTTASATASVQRGMESVIAGAPVTSLEIDWPVPLIRG